MSYSKALDKYKENVSLRDNAPDDTWTHVDDGDYWRLLSDDDNYNHIDGCWKSVVSFYGDYNFRSRADIEYQIDMHEKLNSLGNENYLLKNTISEFEEWINKSYEVITKFVGDVGFGTKEENNSFKKLIFSYEKLKQLPPDEIVAKVADSKDGGINPFRKNLLMSIKHCLFGALSGFIFIMVVSLALEYWK